MKLLHRRPRATTPQLDFVSGRQRHLLGWALLATAVLCTALVAQDWHRLQQQDRLLSEQLVHWQNTRPHRAAAFAAAGPARVNQTANPGANTATARLAAQQLSAALRYPWPALASALEAATPDGVKWLRLEHDRSGPGLRLQGHAPDATTALRVVNALALHSGWRSVVLTRLATTGSAPGVSGLLFDIQCQIDVAAMPVVGL